MALLEVIPNSILERISIRVYSTGQDLLVQNSKFVKIYSVDVDAYQLEYVFYMTSTILVLKIRVKDGVPYATIQKYEQNPSMFTSFAILLDGKLCIPDLDERSIGSEYRLEIKTPAPVKASVEELHTITYYGVKGNSFDTVSQHHIEELSTLGWNIHLNHFNRIGDITTKNIRMKDQIGIIHPVFYVLQNKSSYIDRLKKIHRLICGFDLADTDMISLPAVYVANRLDLIMVPSQCSKQVFLNSGVKIRVEVVPHGLSHLFNASKGKSRLVSSKGVNVLYFCLHSEFRKGADIVHTAMNKILGEYPQVNFVFRGNPQNELARLPRTTCIEQWLSEAELVDLYDSCDIVLAPSRGGGFELNVLEALARGKIVIVSSWDAIQEYAGKYALTIKSTGKHIQPLLENPIHVGFGVDPSSEDCYELIKRAVGDLDSLREEAERNAPEIREKYSWESAAKTIASCLET